MAETYTSNLELVKPDYDSPADIFVINSNMDKIDNAVANAGKVKSINGKTPDGSGAVTLTPGDLGAATAEEVSALKNEIADYWTAVNLLDNGELLIAQAGFMGMHGNETYLADRWFVTAHDKASYDEASKTLTLTAVANPVIIEQRIPRSFPGKPLTAAIKAKNVTGDIYLTERGAQSGHADQKIVDGITCHSFVCGNTLDILFWSMDGGSMSVEWIALYEGSYTAETLPPYVPKGYTEELLECQRYYWKTDMIFRSSSNSTAQTINIQFPIRMRVVPTVKYSLAEGTEPSGFNTSVDGVSYYSGQSFTFNMYEAIADL